MEKETQTMSLNSKAIELIPKKCQEASSPSLISVTYSKMESLRVTVIKCILKPKRA
ncbi:hypothetical protein OIU84_003404 [Salix udensis]|uniref:Uncharacterized protein n=1 Tax=Salix udensis TaxID=889485 RepID=A0AAD6JZU1_9ROSI|nr:hypothetical protein OIU84_003404 [Salix udensis]